MVAARTIDPADLELVRVCDEPKDVVEAIFAHYEVRGFEPSAAEQEILLEL
jgi:predicted Rossmann-fold nucleotide-binding protein